MTQGGAKLPIEVEAEVGARISDLRKIGWSVSASLYDAQCFGNGWVDLCRAGLAIGLVKDRSEYFIDGPIEEIKAAGLLRAFRNFEEFRHVIIHWVTAQYR